MKRFIILFGIATLAGCSQAAVAPVLPSQAQPAGAMPQAGYDRLYNFTGYPSGALPTDITFYNNAFYGTTVGGGTKTFGTIFERNSSGVQIIHNFLGGADGAEPEGALVPLGSGLFGETEYGGSAGDGTVFHVGAGGRENVIYSFQGGSDGATPELGGLVNVSGRLYGTTSAGGNSSCGVHGSTGCGVVFSITSGGTESVIYRFNGKGDGAAPLGTLLDVNGVLYGTTSYDGRYGNGTVFKISTSGSLTTLYSFKGFPDGAMPYAGVTELNGTLYGTTAFGGSFENSGTVYALNASGGESVLHSFRSYPDGAVPFSALTAANGVLFGMTQYGGMSGQSCKGQGVVGCGIVFSITTSGKERVLYRFRGSDDGANPWATLIYQSGELYGTTIRGGSGGEGTIFSIQAKQATR